MDRRQAIELMAAVASLATFSGASAKGRGQMLNPLLMNIKRVAVCTLARTGPPALASAVSQSIVETLKAANWFREPVLAVELTDPVLADESTLALLIHASVQAVPQGGKVATSVLILSVRAYRTPPSGVEGPLFPMEPTLIVVPNTSQLIGQVKKAGTLTSVVNQLLASLGR
jgi:hypothetical protein